MATKVHTDGKTYELHVDEDGAYLEPVEEDGEDES